MLVLTRSMLEGDDEIHIGDDIVIKVVQARGRIRLGIEAPRDVPILRPEAKNKTPKPGRVRREGR